MAYFTDCQEAEPGDSSNLVSSTTDWSADLEENFVDNIDTFASRTSTNKEETPAGIINVNSLSYVYNIHTQRPDSVHMHQ